MSDQRPVVVGRTCNSCKLCLKFGETRIVRRITSTTTESGTNTNERGVETDEGDREEGEKDGVEREWVERERG